MDRYDTIKLIAAIFSRQTAGLILGVLGLSILMAYDPRPPTVLAPLQVIGCPLAEHIAQDALDEMYDIVVSANQDADAEPMKADPPPGC